MLDRILLGAVIGLILVVSFCLWLAYSCSKRSKEQDETINRLNQRLNDILEHDAEVLELNRKILDSHKELLDSYHQWVGTERSRRLEFETTYDDRLNTMEDYIRDLEEKKQ